MNHSTWYRGRPHLEYLVNKTPFCVIYNLNFFGENFIVATCYKSEGKLIRQCWELAVGINGSLLVKGSLLAQVFLQCSVWCQAFFSVSPYLIHLSKLLYSHFPFSSKQVVEYIHIYIFFFFYTEILNVVVLDGGCSPGCYGYLLLHTLVTLRDFSERFPTLLVTCQKFLTLCY